MASARSMPALTPADVQTRPSLTKIAFGSTLILEKPSASLGQYRQWVAARFPSSTPVQASAKAPRHTEATRRALGKLCEIHFINSASLRISQMPGPPGITSVSTCCGRTLEIGAVSTIIPTSVGTSPPEVDRYDSE